ncbi:Cof-type HAD-IIB family hydrolase [Paratissierella segnis]|jgi:hypothetical protein|uniref:HAD family phosphatase n=1 Tax=Paratissierella segnis TaxID=2763679 RepID=A0A926EXC5_9FIRM|nr:Cof-type HAD-IIB family hydrolase [Paratissierella segnis]MBC8587980.1 HAD family phosphatase [Paratissierella segnis]
MYNLLALDLDGTLLNENHEISETNKHMLYEAKKRGVKIILISGREPKAVKYFGNELKLNELIAGLNGGMITDSKAEKIFFNEFIDENLAKKVVYSVEYENLCCVVFIGGKIFTKDKSDLRFRIFENYAVMDIGEVGKLSIFLGNESFWNKISKILLIDDNKKLNSYKESLLSSDFMELTMQFSLPHFLEIYSGAVSKGRALEYISKFYGIRRDQIIAIGDGENDIDMIKFAGLGVSMGNAPDIVKKSSDIVTLSNNEDGVSEIIKNFIIK